MRDVILVTGGAGFIGSTFVCRTAGESDTTIVNLDRLTYAGNLANLASLRGNPRHIFVQGDICDRELIRQLLGKYQPRAIIHFAAESHVDRSIHGPAEFVRTNVLGTFELLEAARLFWNDIGRPSGFRFLHVSTDEVYGSLPAADPPANEQRAYEPNSPYAATKAGADHLARAYFMTYGLPVIMTNCTNNYGPRQFPEKLIPLMILNALEGKPLPVYGDGLNVRDWLYVEDHCAALARVMVGGQPGETYNIAGRCEMTNLDVVRTICRHLPARPAGSHEELITFVKDRPGHDRRYALDTSKIERELGWRPSESFDSGISKTVQWYRENVEWVKDVTSGEYQAWVARHYAGS